MIFIVEDERVLRNSLVEFFESMEHTVEGFADAESALAAARNSAPDVVVTDLQMPGMNGLQLVEALGKVDPGIVRIMVTAHATVQSALTAMRSGCYEYLEKPVDLEKLLRLVVRAMSERRNQTELDWLRRGRNDAEPSRRLLGESDAIQSVRQQIATLGRLGGESPPVLVMGETGVGKGVIARAVHETRFGPQAPFIEVNCAALPATLVEAELFGYERSAFTDAKQAKPGLFEAAANGTIFLDEVGEVALEVQSKLLKVVESRTVRRLGAVRDRPISATIVAASNVNLAAASQDGQFRPDLYHRLAACMIRVPPLRERAADAGILAQAFLLEAASRYRKPLRGLAPDALDRIIQARWPGNVRELRFAIEQAVIFVPDGEELLRASDIRMLEGIYSEPDGGQQVAPSAAAQSAAGNTIEVNGSEIRVVLDSGGVNFLDLEKAILMTALQQTGGNATAAARMLGMTRDTMRYRLRKLGLSLAGAAQATGS